MQDNEQPTYQPEQPHQSPVPMPSKGLAITSLILGIIALLLVLIWFISVPTAIVALVLGIVYLVKRKGIKGGKGMAIAGIVLGAVALLVGLLMTALLFISMPNLQSSSRDTARRNDLGMLSSQIVLYRTNNRGALPEVSRLDTDELTEVKDVVSEGTPTQSIATYEIGADCDGTPSEGSYNLRVQLETGTEYCTNW